MMKKFSKQLSLLLIIVLLSSYMLAGCKKKKNTEVSPGPETSQSASPTASTPPPSPGPTQTPPVEPPPEQGELVVPWVQAEDINKPPSNVGEFLDSDNVDAGNLLDDPAIAEEILGADNLGDLVDSPNDAERLEELAEEIEELIDEMTDDEGNAPDQETQDIVDALEDIREAIEELFADAEPTPEQLEATTELKGTWTEPNKVILRWTPQIEWLPEDGYYLYRIINGEASIVDRDLGMAYKIHELGGLTYDFSPYIVEIFQDSVLDANKLNTIGVTSIQQFNDLVFSSVILNDSMLKISGADEFEQQKTDKFTRPATIIDKVPTGDVFTNTGIHLVTQINTPVMSIMDVQGPVEATPGPTLPVTPVLTLAEETIQLVLDARNSMLTLANTDAEFASAVGFGYEDDFGETSYASNTIIEYVLLPMAEGVTAPETSAVVDESARDGMYSLKVSYGAQTPFEVPENLEGYGVDGEVHLRWQAPETDYAKSIISGYYIERKLNGETGFTRLNDVPVAISYMEDENNILYEVADYYVDYNVENGDRATYKVQALDVFGRLSEYCSEPLSIEVVKTTPPGSPELDQPTLSNNLRQRTESFYVDTLSKYPGETGIILPITKTTSDTESFIIYRSAAWGTGLFSKPEELGRIEIPDDVLPNELTIKSTTGSRYKIVGDTQSDETDAVFYDVNVTPGYFYKYWVAAVDEWGNESAWSNSKVQGYSTENQPSVPGAANARMTFNMLPDLSFEAVGFLNGRFAGIDVVKEINWSGNTVEGGMIARSNVDLAPVQQAMIQDVQIGVSLSDTVRAQLSIIPQLLSLEYGNMPEPRDVHDIIALQDSDIQPNGNADVSWYHYAGTGLGGYNVFRAYVDGEDIDDVRSLSVEEILEEYNWKLVEDNITYNQITDNVDKQDGRIYLYMIAMVPAETSLAEDIGYSGYAPAGWINLTWERPDDLQISHFRVYKAEVLYFSESDNLDTLDWTLVGDNLKYAGYTEEADQTHAHYYYFKITSVSIWGVETEVYSSADIRVASTVPPQAPVMLIPFPQKASVEVRWAGVPYASSYKIFKTRIPKVKEEDIESIQLKAPEMFDKIFMPEISMQIYMPEMIIAPFSQENPSIAFMASGTDIPAITAPEAVSNFNTLQLMAPTTIMNSIKTSPVSTKVDVYNSIVEKYGILAVSPYGLLDSTAAKLIPWEEVHIEEIALGQDSTGEFSFIDTDVEFGDTYMYTVQAWNDDELASERPEPVSVSPRKGEAFPPVTGVSAKIDSDTGQPLISWNAAKDPNLTVDASSEFIAGYIVYRSKTQNGEYYQASPFTTRLGYLDVEADPAAVNWYKVKVIDIGGYTSDFSAAVSTGGQRNFILPSNSIILRPITPIAPIEIIPILPPFGGDEQTIPDTTASTGFVITPIFPPLIIIPTALPETMKIAGFDVINIVTTDNGTPRKGTGELVLANKYTIPVDLTINSWSAEAEVIDGYASLSGNVEIGDTGTFLSSLYISTTSNNGIASGYVLKAGSQETENLIGDLYSLRFNGSEISPGGVIKITDIPEFRYNNIKMSDMESITVNLGAFDASAPAVIQQEGILIGGITIYFMYGTGFINMMNGTAENDLGMETMDNKGLVFSYSIINFDRNGALNGTMTISDMQIMRTVIPFGLGIKTSDAKLVYSAGTVATSQSYLKGKVMLPYKTFIDDAPVSSGFMSIAEATLGNFPMDQVNISSILDKNPAMIKSGSQSVSTGEKNIVDVGMYYVAERAQEQTLLIMPIEAVEFETVSHIPVNITGWDGRGFTVSNKVLSPTLVGNDNEEIGVIGSNVTIDLDRETSTSAAYTPETLDKIWTGMIVKSGRVSLPPAFITTEDSKRVSFNLTAGDMLYDRNGFAYQSQAYSPVGIPVNFGDQLGNFEDVYAHSIYIDLYAGDVSMEIKASLGIPLFGFQRVDVTLYTSEETGKLVCSVDETEKFDPAGTGEVLLSVSGGHLMPDGFHMDGTVDLQFTDSISMSNIAFTELIIPADMDALKVENNPEGLLGSAMFDKPYKIQFHDFDMEIRALSLITRDAPFQVTLLPLQLETGIKRTFRAVNKTMPVTGSVNYYASDLFLWGGMQLSDTLAIDTEEDFDRVVISGVFEDPVISYSESKSKVDMEFEEFAQIDAVATPKMVDPSSGIIEYETETLEMVFNTAMDMFSGVELECNARLGYDKVMSRFFFALALYYHDPAGGIQFAYGTINDLTGVIGYNLDIGYTDEEGYYIPDGKQGLFNYIDDMDVNRDPGGNYFFAASGFMYLGYEGVRLGEVRNMYLVIEKGPTVEMGGKYYGPSTLRSLADGSGLKHMGTVRIGYYHRDKMFKFSLTLNNFGMYGLTVNGDVGFDMSPKYWELRIGYPNTLIAELGSLARAGFGLVIHNTFPPADNYIKTKMFFEYDTGYVTIAIVYFRAYLSVGAEGEMNFNEGTFYFAAYIKGGLEGGIKVGGKRYEIISLHLDALGELEKTQTDWRLEAKVRVRYHLNLFLFDVGGTVTWHMKLKF